MYLQEILEVVIGLIFMWLVLSIAAMSIQEWAGNVFAWRAKALKRSIRGMLTSAALTKEFYAHPLIVSLSPTSANKKWRRLPSYIPADKFASALFDMVTQAGKESSPLKAFSKKVSDKIAAMKNPDQRKLATRGWETILEASKQIVVSGMSQTAVDSLKVQLQVFGNKYPEVQPALEEVLAEVDAFYQKFLEQQKVTDDGNPTADLAMRQFRLGLVSLGEKAPKFKETVGALLRNVDVFTLKGEQAATEMRATIESWFNDAMDRLSGSYKRRSQVISFLLGSLLALSLQIDSINVANSLWREPILRQAVVVQAQAYVDQNELLYAQTATASETDSSTTSITTADMLQSTSEIQQLLDNLGIPFGWKMAAIDTGERQCSLVPYRSDQIWGIAGHDDTGAAICKGISNLPQDLSGWLTKLLGFLITGAATAQGAPFWFDILKKIINIRSSGTKPTEQSAVG